MSSPPSNDSTEEFEDGHGSPQLDMEDSENAAISTRTIKRERQLSATPEKMRQIASDGAESRFSPSKKMPRAALNFGHPRTEDNLPGQSSSPGIEIIDILDDSDDDEERQQNSQNTTQRANERREQQEEEERDSAQTMLPSDEPPTYCERAMKFAGLSQILLNRGNIVKDRVSHSTPTGYRAFRGDVTYIVDVYSLRDPLDLRADGLGKYNKSSADTHGFLSQPNGDLKRVDKKHKIQDGQIFDFKIRCTYAKVTSSGSKLQRKIYEVFDAQENLQQYGAVVYAWDAGTDPVQFDILPHGNLKATGNNRRHGNEEEFMTLMGVMQALVSFVQTRDDSVESFWHAGWKFVFVRRSPLIFVACASTDDSVPQLRQQLLFMNHQILSTLTRTQLVRIFENKKNFDLRRLLSGTEKTLSALLDIGSADPSHMLCAVRCLPLPSSTREALGQALVSGANKVKNLVFGILIAKQQLITMVRLKRYTLHPSDLHLLINLVQCNPSFRNAESWSPVCLPRFDDTGFLHAHISYLEEGSPVCLLLLTVDRNAFFTMSEVRTKFLEKMAKNKLMTGLIEACEAKQGIGLTEIGIPDVLHFLYKNRSSSQLCCSTFEPPYVSEAERLRLIDNYLRLIDRIHNIEEFDQPLRILYVTGEKEALLGWVTSNFELYTAFHPMITKQAAVAKVDKLMKWLKKEEERLFILNPLVF